MSLCPCIKMITKDSLNRKSMERYYNLNTGRYVTKIPKGFLVDKELKVVGTEEQVQRFKYSKGSTEFSLKQKIYSARVVRILDGDTIDVVVNLKASDVIEAAGCFSGLMARFLRSKKRFTIRCAGYDAYEKNTPQGKEAKHQVEMMIKPDTKVYFRSEGTEKFGRQLASIYLSRADAEKGNYKLKDSLIAMNLAYPYSGGTKQACPYQSSIGSDETHGDIEDGTSTCPETYYDDSFGDPDIIYLE